MAVGESYVRRSQEGRPRGEHADELVPGPRVLMAGRFGPDGREAEHKTSGLYVEVPALTRIMQWFAPRAPRCWARLHQQSTL
jgi:hypothetical protein